jgi:hypothetical protein
MPRGLALLSAGLLVFLAVARSASAQQDPGAARENLKQGYALKKAGKCADAVPFFVESERLDPQAKTLINLAECEEELHRYVGAQTHLAEARDRARAGGQDELRAIAETRLKKIEAKTPRLTIALASGAPPDTEVLRDGVLLGLPSLGAPLPVDPGKHTIVARSGSLAPRTYDVTLGEGETKTIVVAPGDPGAAPSVHSDPVPAAPPDRPTTEPVPQPAPSAPDATPSDGPSRVPAFVALGVGVVGVGVGSALGIAASSKWSKAKEECGAGCGATSAAYSTREDAKTMATGSTVAFVVGGVGLAAGIVLLLLPHGSEGSRAAFHVSVTPAPAGTGLGVGGRF